MEIRAGTSGFSYKEWKGCFYPEKLPANKMLGFYSTQLNTVEINNTFYRLPKPEMLESWAKQVPEDFRFSIKAARRITHIKRLKDVKDETEFLLTSLETLGARLGVVLFQLPPFLRKDLASLDAFLALLPDDTPAAFEFRHASWFDEDVLERLKNRNFAVCVADTEKAAGDVIGTALWGYLRLRRSDYSDQDLESWAKRVASQSWDRAFVFFKHEDEGAGPKFAARFMQLAGNPS